ncbi:MAG: histidine kinase [Rhodospirillales bacterium]|nr:histidine kinase [Rhodospirillales bacterium]
MGSSLFALGLGLRAAIVGVIAFTTIRLVSLGHYHATALVLTGVALLVLADIARSIMMADRMLERFLDGLSAGSVDRPPAAGRYSGFRRLTDAIGRKAAALDAVRAARAGQIDYFQALADTVAIILFVVEPDGSIVLANRAARQFAGRAVRRLDDIGAVGQIEAAALLSLPVGERTILRLANGQRVLASAARFTAGSSDRRLISLQHIENELDAIELKAWQDLVRILSHEIMNSLTPISSLAESIRPLTRELGLASGPDHAQAANDIAVAVDTISRRSTGLVDFVERYRKIAALPRPVLQTIRLGDFVARLEQLVGPFLGSKSIVWQSRVEPDDLGVIADPELLEQALINLLHNAAEAVGGIDNPCIALNCARHDDGRIAISVADNGPGIDPASHDKIFLPFFTTKPGGSGIGLSLSRNIAVAHAGQIEVAANFPTGAVFRLILPA